MGYHPHIDVIDTSFMEGNVHAMRHSFFNINRLMVDDLYEIIVNHKRAYQRQTHLMRRGGNVFYFLEAPAHVYNP